LKVIDMTRVERLARARARRRLLLLLLVPVAFLGGGLMGAPLVAHALGVVDAKQADSDLAQAQALIRHARASLQNVTTTSTPPPSTPHRSMPLTVATRPAALDSNGAQPLGVPGTWKMAFADEFSASALDTSIWNTSGSFQCCDQQRSNIGNGELDYKATASSPNFTAASGALSLEERREPAPNGMGWTGAQIVSKQSFTYGVVEMRAKLPSPQGFAPAFWTWGAPGTNAPAQETDVFEAYTNRHDQVWLTSHAGATAGCGNPVTVPFDTSTGFHTYAADIEPTGTDWYIDGVRYCHVGNHPTEPWNLIAYTPPVNTKRVASTQLVQPSTTKAALTIDHIRVWSH
jgi:beta-glucanase (GH16 family)